MPELGEVAHATGLLRKYVLGKRITHVSSQPDDLLYVKPLTNAIFNATVENQKVTDIARNGKYFMVEVDHSKTLVMHFGMTGWIRAKNVDSIIMMESGGDRKQKQKMNDLIAKGEDPKTAMWASFEWPPKFTKFTLTTDDDVEIAFSDPRRLARIRLLDVPVAGAKDFEPLSKLGTDFSLSQPPASEVVPAILKRRVPVKSLLLDQTLFSGVGNWMADEILHLARIHPEQYANTLGTKKAEELYEKILEVCRIAAETEGNSAAFPSHWLMLHRWGKSRSKKEVQKTAAGHVVSFVSVGGRTSCFVPELQKKFKAIKEDEEENAADDIKKEAVDGPAIDPKEEEEEPKEEHDIENGERASRRSQPLKKRRKTRSA